MSAVEFNSLLFEINADLDKWRTKHNGTLQVLEAGGGAFSTLELTDVHITTIDVSAEQIEKNQYADRKIVGDLQDFKFEEGEFDIIVCFDVLEHLAEPEKVLQSFIHAIKPGGIIYIAAPYNRSIAGLIAKFTPHWFHVFCYRHIFGANPTDPNKERIHEFVFPTYMKPAMNPFRVKNTFESAKMQTRFFRLYSRDKRDHLYNVSSILGWGYDLVALTGRLVSLGTARPDCTDYFLLAERPNQGPGY